MHGKYLRKGSLNNILQKKFWFRLRVEYWLQKAFSIEGIQDSLVRLSLMWTYNIIEPMNEIQVMILGDNTYTPYFSNTLDTPQRFYAIWI